MEMKVVMRDPKKSDYFYEESIKTLRTNIQFLGKQTKTILFTSCYQNEGKSDVSFTLSVEMGKTGKRVLLIDADIRKSSYIRRFTLSVEMGKTGKRVLLIDADIRKSSYIRRFHVKEKVAGLSQYLSGQMDMNDVIYQTNFENVDIIFSGPVAPKPSELLNDAEFEKLLKDKKEEYDYIFIDTPPALNLTDATVVARHCDGGQMPL